MKNFDLNTPSRRNPFSVPDGYFDHLTQRVMAQIPTESVSTSVQERSAATIVKMPNAKRHTHWIGWGIAAAACIAGAVFFLHIPESSAPSEQATAQTSVQEIYDDDYQQQVLEYAMVDNCDIYSYLSGDL